MYACYFSVYISIYLRKSLVCFTLEIYNLSIGFRNWTKIYNERINLKPDRTAQSFFLADFKLHSFAVWTLKIQIKSRR
jgi:hypothetical protein